MRKRKTLNEARYELALAWAAFKADIRPNIEPFVRPIINYLNKILSK